MVSPPPAGAGVGGGFYREEVGAKEGKPLIDYSLRVDYLGKPSWLFVISCP